MGFGRFTKDTIVMRHANSGAAMRSYMSARPISRVNKVHHDAFCAVKRRALFRHYCSGRNVRSFSTKFYTTNPGTFMRYSSRRSLKFDNSVSS